MEPLEILVVAVKIGMWAVAVVAFIAIVWWALRQPQSRIDADAHLWKDE